MIQLQSFSRTLMVIADGAARLIGVALTLLVLDKPFGFVALLGTIALPDHHAPLDDTGRPDPADIAADARLEAVVGATVRRFRPIVLTAAAAAVLGLVPLIRSDYFGPMAVAMMGGITIATGLTLLFLPALYRRVA